MIISLNFNELLFEVFILYSDYFIETLSPFTASPISIPQSPVSSSQSTPKSTPVSTPKPTPVSTPKPVPTPIPTPIPTQTPVPTPTLSVQNSIVINEVTYLIQEKTYQSFKSYEYSRSLGNKNVFNISSKDGNLFPVNYNNITYSMQLNYYSKYDDLKMQLIRVMNIHIVLISRILQDLEFHYRKI